MYGMDPHIQQKRRIIFAVGFAAAGIGLIVALIV